MDCIVSHQSALEFWRNASAKEALAGKKLRITSLPVATFDVDDLRVENFWNLAAPLHVLIGSANARKTTQSLHCHVGTGEYPGGSFIRMDSGMTVCSPELCFLQMGGELSLVDLVKLGFEFCGSYRLNEAGTNGKGFRGDEPLTSVARLVSYAKRATWIKGRANALRALSFIIDSSASPMETILTMLLTLPYRLGGFGLPKPMLNYRIETPLRTDKSSADSPVIATIGPTGIRTASSNASADKLTYYCDLYWPHAKVALEYDSDFYHTGSYRIEKDAIRRNALTAAGVAVVTASRRQVVDKDKLRELAEKLSKLLGKRLKCEAESFPYLRAKLLEQLMV